MRLIFTAAALAATTLALLAPQSQSANALRTLEFGPDDVRIVTEAEKWAFKREGRTFFDITGFPKRETHIKRSPSVAFPIHYNANTTQDPYLYVRNLMTSLSGYRLRRTLDGLMKFKNRYYDGKYGGESYQWILQMIKGMIADRDVPVNVTVETMSHPWPQQSIIVRFAGQSEDTIVLGAHQDSINLDYKELGVTIEEAEAPGADDNATGAAILLDILSVLLDEPVLSHGLAINPIELHWYAAEEGGLLGSMAVFEHYKYLGRAVAAMLNVDMAGYVKPGEIEAFGVVTDNVDKALTNFIKHLIGKYTNLPFVETKCGYACSDHASAQRAGYASAFVFESRKEHANPHIHTTEDVIEKLSTDHMLEHAKLALSFVYEAAFVRIPPNRGGPNGNAGAHAR